MSLVFCSLNIICIGINFFGISPVCHSLSILDRWFGCLINFGKFSAIITSNISSVPFFFLSGVFIVFQAFCIVPLFQDFLPFFISKVELPDYIIILFLIFCGPSILFFTMAAPFYIPSKRAYGFPLLHILANIHYFLSF